MITLHNISKSHRSKLILQEITATIERGDFIMVMGANGSGKTTLFNLLAGTTRPDYGIIEFEGKDITSDDDHVRAPWIGKLAQNPSQNVVDTMTVAENLALALCAHNCIDFAPALSIVTPEIVATITREYGVDLTPLLHTPMQLLSGGQRQLIAFIMITLAKPKLLLLDEPTAALDPQAATTLLACVYRFIHQHQVTALLVTHDPAMTAALGNKLWLVKNRKITEYNAQQKNELSSDDLVGSIAYDRITTQKND